MNKKAKLKYISLKKLKFNKESIRLKDQDYKVINTVNFLFQNNSILKLLLSIGENGYFNTEPLIVMKTKNNEKHIGLSIKELNAVNEMSLMVGLVLLTLGNFLGGVWANESWGRYWGWDPKETWALVTILVYAVVVHIRFIKEIYSEFNFAVISLMSFTTVMMTYFGVNYYLAGLHSYAKGDPVPIPDFVPITYAILFVVIALAFRNRKII